MEGGGWGKVEEEGGKYNYKWARGEEAGLFKAKAVNEVGGNVEKESTRLRRWCTKCRGMEAQQAK
jgi:hypothetical protein